MRTNQVDSVVELFSEKDESPLDPIGGVALLNHIFNVLEELLNG